MQDSSEPAAQIDIPDKSQPDGIFRLQLPYEQKTAQAGDPSFLPFFLFLLFIISLYILFSTIGQPELLCTKKGSAPSHEHCLWRAKVAVVSSGVIVFVILLLTLKFALQRDKINKSGKQFIRITPTEFQNYRLAAPIKFDEVTKVGRRMDRKQPFDNGTVFPVMVLLYLSKRPRLVPGEKFDRAGLSSREDVFVLTVFGLADGGRILEGIALLCEKAEKK